MNKLNDDVSEKILKNWQMQEEKLIKILDLQKKIRLSVNKRDWSVLESSTRKMDSESVEFKNLDKELGQIFEENNITSIGDFYVCVRNLNFKNENKSRQIIKLYDSVRSKLVQSQVENKALNDYVKITNSFLQEVYDKANPNRLVRYSRKGSIVKNRPESLLLNTIM